MVCAKAQDSKTEKPLYVFDGKGTEMLSVEVNGKKIELAEACSLSELVRTLGYTFGPVAIERNLEIVPRAEHEKTSVCDGDRIEIVHFVGGG